MKSVLYLCERKARLVINDTNNYEVHIAKESNTSDHYFWEIVGVHKGTNLGLQKALTQYYMTIVFKIDKDLLYKSMKVQ